MIVPIRFTDARGTEWEVRELGVRTVPADRRPARAPVGGRRGGPWLCFESATQQRRLDRYPEWWRALPAQELAELCRAASPAPPPVMSVPWAPPRHFGFPEDGP